MVLLPIKLNDPRGYAKIFVDETLGAEKLRMHIFFINPGMRAHEPYQHEGKEIYFILEGEAEVSIEDESFLVNANTVVFVTSDKMHGIKKAGNGILKYMVIIAK